MGDWADLPIDLLALIAKRIDLYEDFVAFGGVCPSWRSVAVKENFNPSAVIPWLMLPTEESRKKEASRNLVQGFISLTKHGMVRKVEFSEARGRRFINSSMGWLVTTVDGVDEMELLHPLTRANIPLPHPRTCNKKEMRVHKAVLSASPSETEDYVLMAILGPYNVVGFWKPGNNIWTVIETNPSCWINDVVYYKDQFYAINHQGHLLLCNLNSGTLQIIGQLPPSAIAAFNGKAYLVDSCSELLVVSTSRNTFTRIRHNYYYNIDTGFRVFKFDTTNSKPYREKEISDFGGRSIFVDRTAATVVAASDAAGTKPNCIYFAACFANRYVIINPSIDKKNTGIYRWEYRTEIHSLYHNIPPIWVIPSF